MPRKIKNTKSKIVTTKGASSDTIPGGKLNNYLNNWSGKFLDFKKSKTFYLVILALALSILVIYKKSWFVAALVNGQPITNLELQNKLNQQFKTQILNQLINEKIILLEASKVGAVPTDAEIDQRISELETQVGGKEILDNLLTQQGQTRFSLRDQIKVQLAISKLYEKEASVSAEEVAQFIEQNRDQMRATDSAALEKEATDNIKNQKLSQIFTQKFQELREKANIQVF